MKVDIERVERLLELVAQAQARQRTIVELQKEIFELNEELAEMTASFRQRRGFLEWADQNMIDPDYKAQAQAIRNLLIHTPHANPFEERSDT